MIKSLFIAVAIIANGSGYNTSLATHLSRWLKTENIIAAVTPAERMKDVLKDEKLAFLVGFNEPDSVQMKTLKSFCYRGGKLVVFHSASPALAELMGVRPIGYKVAPYPGAWSRMDFSSDSPAGFPKQILQSSGVLQKAEPLPGKSRVIATWSDRTGKPTHDAAWLASANGYWMTHVLFADGDEPEKAQLCAAIVGNVEPQLWSYAAHIKRKERLHQQTRALALKQIPRKGEIHAVWDHSGCGLYPGNWARTIKILQEARVTDLFVNVAGAGFAHYPSEVLPRSSIYNKEGDQLAACLKAARYSGIRVHAWMLCFNATRSSPEVLQTFEQRGWRLVSNKGALTEYLNPANKNIQNYLLRAIDELQENYPGLAGIHLDFVRFYEGAKRPNNAASVISDFVMAARRHVRRPWWLTTAVLGKYPACIASVGQDWDSWLNSGIVDYVVPMDYTADNAKFESYAAQHGAIRAHARRTIAGIGVTANESRLDAQKVIEQINISRKYGLAGNALFDLDRLLETRVLPYLKLGIW